MTSAMIDVDRVCFSYTTTRVLDNITVQWSEGDFVTIVGRNGSGKSTLARCMAGFLRPQEGKLRIQGSDVGALSPRKRVHVVGYVFQNPDHQLFRESVEDEVQFGLRNVGVAADEAERRVSEVLERLELADKRAMHPFRLARGDRQRLAIAALAVLQPSVLIVDEPTTGQDPVKAREIMSLLRDLNEKKGITIVVITHAMDLVAEYARTVAVMSQGRLLRAGSPREVFADRESLDQASLVPPAVVRLGLEMNIEPLPLTVAEFRDGYRRR